MRNEIWQTHLERKTILVQFPFSQIQIYNDADSNANIIRAAQQNWTIYIEIYHDQEINNYLDTASNK